MRVIPIGVSPVGMARLMGVFSTERARADSIGVTLSGVGAQHVRKRNRMQSNRLGAITRHPLVLVVTIGLLGLCMRAPILSGSPLLDTITTDLGLSAAQAGWISTIPVLCFGTVALTAPMLLRRWPMDAVLLAMFIVLICGLLLRTLPPVWILFAGTILVGSGIAVSNVIMPGFIEREAPNRVGQMTALYSAAISASGAIGAGATIPIMQRFDLDWRGALRWPALLVLVGIVLLIPWQFRGDHRHALSGRDHPHRVNLWRNKVAWFVTGYMGMQSFVFISTTGWLPTYLISEGMDEQRAGYMLSLSPLLGVAGSFIAPLLVYRRPDQRWLVWVSSAFCAIGLLGLILWPLTGTLLWVAIFGFGSGMTLSIALTFIGLRTPDSRHAADLSMMSQSVGYSIAAAGPITIGFAHDLVGNWQLPFTLILLSTVVLTLVGLGGGRNRLVSDVTVAP